MATRKQPYHRGNLPEVLRSAAADLVSERGPSGFSLREVARRADVSHAAPAHHFSDTRGLLTSLASEGFERLATSLSEAAASESDPAERLRRCGEAYVSTAIQYPGHFAVIFRQDLLNEDDPGLEEHGSAAFQCLIDTIELIRDELNPDLDVDRAATLCWATMQGLITIAPTLGTKIDEIDREALSATVADLTALMLDGFRPR